MSSGFFSGMVPSSFPLTFVALTGLQAAFTYYQSANLKNFKTIEDVRDLFISFTLSFSYFSLALSGITAPVGSRPLILLPLIAFPLYACERKLEKIASEEWKKKIDLGNLSDKYLLCWGRPEGSQSLRLAFAVQFFAASILSLHSERPLFYKLAASFSLLSLVFTSFIRHLDIKYLQGYVEGHTTLGVAYRINFFRPTGLTSECLACCDRWLFTYSFCQSHAYHLHSIVQHALSKVSNSDAFPRCPACRGRFINGWASI